LILNLLSLFKISLKDNALRHWKLQRLSAIFLLFLIFPFSIIMMINLDDFSYELVESLLKRPIIFLYFVFFVSLACFHSKLGIEIIIEDYISNQAFQSLILQLSLLIHCSAVIVCIFSLCSIFFGSN